MSTKTDQYSEEGFIVIYSPGASKGRKKCSKQVVMHVDHCDTLYSFSVRTISFFYIHRYSKLKLCMHIGPESTCISIYGVQKSSYVRSKLWKCRIPIERRKNNEMIDYYVDLIWLETFVLPLDLPLHT
jgi:hypothetical protein